MADARVTLELLEEVLTQRDPAHRPAHGGGPRGTQPAELRRPVAGVKEAAGARVVGALIEMRSHALGFRRAARVGPGGELGGRPARANNNHQAVPVAREPGTAECDLFF